ncbi:MAG: VOC family protein [Gemmatimonadaceae bacterium]
MENGTAPTPATDKNFDAASLMASITVNDMATSVAWYRDALGFEVGQQFDRDGRVAATQISAGAVRLLLNQEDGAKGADRKKGQGISLQFSTSQNIDAIADRARSHGATLVSEPTDMPWGARMFRLNDPDGFMLVISSIW